VNGCDRGPLESGRIWLQPECLSHSGGHYRVAEGRCKRTYRAPTRAMSCRYGLQVECAHSIDASGVRVARVLHIPGCMYVGTSRPPLFTWIISSARSMAPP
jgi:hypothetical protein